MKRTSKKTFRICYFCEKAKRKELEKVLKIIKEKGVRELSVVEDLCNWNWDEYVKLPCSKIYTKTEFDLLKEYLK